MLLNEIKLHTSERCYITLNIFFIFFLLNSTFRVSSQCHSNQNTLVSPTYIYTYTHIRHLVIISSIRLIIILKEKSNHSETRYSAPHPHSFEGIFFELFFFVHCFVLFLLLISCSRIFSSLRSIFFLRFS